MQSSGHGERPPVLVLLCLLLTTAPLSYYSADAQAQQPVARVTSFPDLLSLLEDPEVDIVELPEDLVTSGDRRTIEVRRQVTLRPALGVADALWNQAGVAGVIRVGAGGLVRVEGRVTFTGCPALDDRGTCRGSEYFPGVFEVYGGGRVVLQGSQVVCSAEASSPAAVARALRDSVELSPDIWRVGARKVVVNQYVGCAGESAASGTWRLQSVTLVHDVAGCFERGGVVSTGKELQRALAMPNPNIYIAEDVTMLDAEWPSNGTHVTWPVNITACGGVVWDTNELPQTLFVWTGGRLLIDGRNNMTIANSRPSVRRGNVWQLVGAFSVEVNGSIVLEDLEITASVPSALHREDITLNPPTHWPLPCCYDGELIHSNASSLQMSWKLVKSEWVYGSTGNVLPEIGFWEFNNVRARVVLPEDESCFSDYGVVVTTPQQLLDALNDPELLHIELKSSMDLRDWKLSSVVVERHVIIRSCAAHTLIFPARRDVIVVQGSGYLCFERDIIFSFLDVPGGQRRNPLSVREGGSMKIDRATVDCSAVIVYPYSTIIEHALEGTTSDIQLVDDYHILVSSYTALASPDRGIDVTGRYLIANTTLTRSMGFVESEVPSPTSPIKEHEGSVRMTTWAIVVVAVAAAVLLVVLGLVAWIRHLKRKQPRSTEADGGNTLCSFKSGSSNDTDWTPAAGNSLHGMVSSIMNQRWGEKGPSMSTNTEQVQILELLGAGGSAKVYRGFWKGVVVAFKVVQIPPQHSKLEKQQSKIAMETAISTALRHPNVVQTFSFEMVPLKGTYQEAAHGMEVQVTSDATNSSGGVDLPSEHSSTPTESRISMDSQNRVQLWEVRIIQEYCSRGSLYSALQGGRLAGQSGRRTPPDVILCLQIALDVACGMHHIHSMKICHGDLKAQNVLLTSQERESGTNILAKIADFGLSVLMSTEQTHVSGVTHGTITHLAPEVLLTGRMTSKTDVYAYGIFLYELFSGHKVFDGMTGIAITHAVITQRRRPTFPPGTPIKVVELACRCWEHDEPLRPDFEQIMEAVTEMIQLYEIGALNTCGSRHSLTASEDSPMSEETAARMDDDAESMRALQMQRQSMSSSGSSRRPLGKRSPRKASFTSASRCSNHLPVEENSVEEEDDDDDDDEKEEEEEEETNTVLLTNNFMKQVSKSSTDAESRDDCHTMPASGSV